MYVHACVQPGGDRVSLQESVNLVSQGTTGLSTWQVKFMYGTQLWSEQLVSLDQMDMDFQN